MNNNNGHHKREVDPELPESGMDLEQMWYVVREKAWLILLCGLIGICGGLAYIHHTPLTYFADTLIEVDLDTAKVVNYPELQETKDPLSEELAQTLLAVFKSRAFAQEVIETNHLLTNPDFLTPRADGRPYTMDEAIGPLIGMTRAVIRTGTRFIDVGVQHSDPRMAREISSMVANTYLERTRKQQEAAANGAIQILMDQAADASKQLTQDQHALQKYVEETKTGSLVEAHDTVVADLKTKSGALSAAHSARLRLEADDEDIQKHINDADRNALLSIPSVANAPVIVESRRLIKEYEAKIELLDYWYTEKHPKMIQARLQLENEKKILLDNVNKMPAEIHAEREAAVVMESKFDAAVRQQEQLAMDLDEKHIDYDVLNRKVETDQALYNGLLTQFNELKVASAAQSTGMHLFEAAQLPMEPMQARKSRTLAIALGAGLVLGLLLAVGLHMLDSSLKTVDQTEDVLGLTALASIPRQGQNRLKESSHSLVKAPGSMVAEAFRSLRTSVYLAGRTKGRKIILFTSTLAGEGKTFCSTNYAMALAQQGLRTLLIDADLRSPMICKVLLGNKKLSGLADLLCHKVDAGAAIHATEIENLWVMPSGELVPNPAELLARSDMGEIVRDLSGRFDRIVIDTAPVTAVSDTLLLLEHAQAICLVVHAGKTPRKWILRAIKLIAEAGSKPDGVVLNQMPMRMAGAYSYYPGRYGEPEVYGASNARKGSKKDEPEIGAVAPRFQ